MSPMIVILWVPMNAKFELFENLSKTDLFWPFAIMDYSNQTLFSRHFTRLSTFRLLIYVVSQVQ